MWGNMECNNHVCNNMYQSNFHISSQRISTQHSIKHSSLFITNTFITILGVNIYSTAVPTIKMAACIVCLIITITISDPIWITTSTTYIWFEKKVLKRFIWIKILHEDMTKKHLLRKKLLWSTYYMPIIIS